MIDWKESGPAMPMRIEKQDRGGISEEEEIGGSLLTLKLRARKNPDEPDEGKVAEGNVKEVKCVQVRLGEAERENRKW